jgi:hypothetical protein
MALLLTLQLHSSSGRHGSAQLTGSVVNLDLTADRSNGPKFARQKLQPFQPIRAHSKIINKSSIVDFQGCRCMDKAYLRSAYRRLWRAAHHAVQNRYPQKRTIREKLRYAFRHEESPASAIEIDNTEQFLLTAGRRRGVENQVVKGLCMVHWSRAESNRSAFSRGD